MVCCRAYVSIAIFAATSGASAESLAPLKDAQILHVIHTAGQIDIAAANLALKKSSNSSVREFATAVLSDHTAAGTAVQSLVTQWNIQAQDNQISQSLAGRESEQTQDLSKLSGPAFDKAYTQNELAFVVFVTGALEVTLIPSTQSHWVKSLLQNELALFKRHYNQAAQLASQFK